MDLPFPSPHKTQGNDTLDVNTKQICLFHMRIMANKALDGLHYIMCVCGGVCVLSGGNASMDTERERERETTTHTKNVGNPLTQGPLWRHGDRERT